jgi:hypothetical protein
VRNVHGLLRKNRRILSELYDEDRKTVHKDALFAMGYNFNFFTHIIESADSSRFMYCFEYGFREKGDEFIELKKNSEYLEYQVPAED